MATEIHIEKVAIPRLPHHEAMRRRKLKTEDEKKQLKRLSDQKRNKTRVNIGHCYETWRDLRDSLGYALDSDLAVLLLDSYKKLTESFSPQTTESATSSPHVSAGSQSHHDEKHHLTSLQSGPLLAKCPSCGFVLPQWCLQNRNIPKKVPQPQSVEVTLELETKDEEVSGAEEAVESDGSDGDSEEEEEESERNQKGSSDEDWTPPENLTATGKTTEASATEGETSEGEEGSDGSGVEEEHRTPTKPAAAEDDGETAQTPGKRKLCTECGAFYKKLPHECEHKTKPFACNICGKRCVSESALKIHSGIHSEYYEHACKFCYANFRTRAAKLAHELTHRDQRNPFRCPDCELTFPTFKERIKHIKQHREETPFTCVVCGIVFRQRSRFLRHAVVHTGERAYKCPMCERGFNQKGHLESHMRLHTGERPYGCRHCDKSFNHNVSLKSHVQRYHPAEEEEEERGGGGGEEGDVRSETPETGANEEERDSAAKVKYKKPSSGRPKGRPKRSATEKRENPKASDSEEDSEWFSTAPYPSF